MRSTTFIWFLATSLALLFPALTYAAPVAQGEMVRRQCSFYGCRVAEPTTTNTTTTTDSATTPQTGDTPTVLGLVDMLISALDAYRNQYTPSGSTTVTDFHVPGDTVADPTHDTPTTDGSPAVAAVNSPEVVGEEL